MVFLIDSAEQSVIDLMVTVVQGNDCKLDEKLELDEVRNEINLNA